MADFLTDAYLKKIRTLFVENVPTDNHVCGTCIKRIVVKGEPDKAGCGPVEGIISLNRGTCRLWEYGKEAEGKEYEPEKKVSQLNAGYIEFPEGKAEKVNCGTCMLFGRAKEKDGDCLLYGKRVYKSQCCTEWDNSQAKTPKTGNPAVAEDLMYEHGVYRRLVGIYANCLKRVKNGELRIAEIVKVSNIIKDFVEEFHEKIEERYIFPAFISAGKNISTINLLLKQHKLGRVLTSNILFLAQQKGDNHKKLEKLLEKYIGMMGLHGVREDTDIFRKLEEVIPEEQLRTISYNEEKLEREKFGEKALDKLISEIRPIEKELGISLTI